MNKPILHHVNLKTPRPDEMIAWYEQMVGIEVVHRFEGGAWLSNDDANHRIALLTSPEIVDDPELTSHAGMHHVAFEFASIDDLLDHWVEIDAERRGDLHMALDHGMTLSFYFVDPDRNSVELQGDWFGDWSESKRFMREAPEFEADPIGAFVDPAAMVSARAAGAGTAELHARAYRGDFKPSVAPDMLVAGIGPK